MYEREIFLAALDKPAAERGAFVANICAGNHTLRARVEALLAEEEQLAGFLEAPAVGALPRTEPMIGPGGTELAPHLTEQPGDRIGRYKLLQKIGEGGCGVVYMAEQQEPVRRRVALKIIRLGMDTRSVIARFEAERQALAMMDHPNIARVYDAGATDTGRPFFVMELVRGIRITEYCDQNNLPTEQRLNLFVQLCQAIQHAHQKGIIHRDIKPSNILVTLHDGVPVPKVIDFGIAKATEQRLTEKTLFTEFSAFIGTPAYMSPEQAEMSGLDIDTRSDVYSLGVLLYELLTGKTPFDPETLLRAGLDGCRRTIREQEPERPSTRLATMVGVELTTTADRRRTPPAILLNELRGDLDWIVMKALEKDRTRRYPTANDLAEDVRRYLANDAVQARPPSNYYRFQKAVRRNRVAFAAAGAVAAALVLGATISVRQAIRATDAEHTAREAQQQESVLRQQAVAEQQRAETEKSAARLNEYIADINLAQQSLTDGNYGRAVQLLNKHLPKAGEPDLRGFEWRYLWHVSQGDEHTALPKQDFPVQSLALSPDKNLLAVGGFEKVSVLDVRNRSVVRTLAKGGSSVAFLPDGKLLTLSRGGTMRTWDPSNNWSEQPVMLEVSPPFALSGDSRFVAATAREGRGPPGEGRWRESLVVWDAETWQTNRAFPGASAPTAFSADGRWLAMATRDGIMLTSIQNGAGAVVLENSTNVFVRGPGAWARAEQSLAFTPDGSAILAARNVLSEHGIFVLSIWDARTGKEIGRLPESAEQIEHTGVIAGMAFSPDGQTLATASMDHSIRLWDFKQRKRIATLHGHVSEVWALAFAPDGKSIITGGKDGSVKLWDTQRPQKEDAWSIASSPLAFSRDGHKLAALNDAMDKGTGGREATVVFVNMRTGEVEERFPLDVPRSRFRLSVAISDDLSRIAHTAESGVRLVNTETGEATILGDRRVEWVEMSPNGQDLITGSFDFRESRLRWWDVRAGTNFVVDTEAFRGRFSPDGKLLAAFGRSNIVEVWNVRSRSLQKRIALLDPQTQIGPGHTFSGDGRFLAVGFMDGSHRMYEVATGKLVSTFTGHKQGIGAIAFSPDGKTLATASDDSTVRLWNIQTQQELITDRRLGGAVQSLMFSPDGQTLVAGTHPFGGAGSIRLYRAPAPKNADLARF
jgi:eukaryotic-like serine/threonine-protein kinase